MRGHQRVLVEIGAFEIRRIAEIRVATVRDVDRAAEHAIEHRVASRRRSRQRVQQRMALVFRRRLLAEQVEQRGGDVGGLRERVTTGAGAVAQRRVMQEERNVRDLVVAGHQDLGPPVVLAQQETVIGGHDQRGVVPHRVAVHVIAAFAPLPAFRAAA